MSNAGNMQRFQKMYAEAEQRMSMLDIDVERFDEMMKGRVDHNNDVEEELNKRMNQIKKEQEELDSRKKELDKYYEELDKNREALKRASDFRHKTFDEEYTKYKGILIEARKGIKKLNEQTGGRKGRGSSRRR